VADARDDSRAQRVVMLAPLRTIVYMAGLTGTITDVKELEIYSTGKPCRRKSFVQDKGRASMIKAFITRVVEGGAPLIPSAEIFAMTPTAFALIEFLGTRQTVSF